MKLPVRSRLLVVFFLQFLLFELLSFLNIAASHTHVQYVSCILFLVIYIHILDMLPL